MLIALLLFVSAIAVGFYSRVMTAVGLSGLVVALSVVVWIARGDVSPSAGSYSSPISAPCRRATCSAPICASAATTPDGADASPEPDRRLAERQDRPPQEQGRRAENQHQRQGRAPVRTRTACLEAEHDRCGPGQFDVRLGLNCTVRAVAAARATRRPGGAFGHLCVTKRGEVMSEARFASKIAAMWLDSRPRLPPCSAQGVTIDPCGPGAAPRGQGVLT